MPSSTFRPVVLLVVFVFTLVITASASPVLTPALEERTSNAMIPKGWKRDDAAPVAEARDLIGDLLGGDHDVVAMSKPPGWKRASQIIKPPGWKKVKRSDKVEVEERATFEEDMSKPTGWKRDEEEAAPVEKL